MNFRFDPLSYSYPSRRNVVFSKKGMVATGNPLAAQAGLEILKKGGNAIDAAVATAAALTVAEPTANGIGSDSFAIFWKDGKLYGMNSSGPAPMKTDADALRKAGYEKIPNHGPIPVTVPGAVSSWAALVKNHGKLDLSEVLEPAAVYAEEGFPLQPEVGRHWGRAFEIFSEKAEKEEMFRHWADTFAPDGRKMGPSDIIRLSDHAKTLRQIGETWGESFYRGEIAQKTVDFLRKCGSSMTMDDFSEFRSEFTEPLSTDFGGYDIFEMPPNGHGIAVLMALNILKEFDLKDTDSAESLHIQIEAMKLALTDAGKYVTDPDMMKIKTEELLSHEYASDRASKIGNKAVMPEPYQNISGGTVYLCTADMEGNMVSYIQSNYMGFGSGLVVPGTGIALHNRGANFSLDPSHDNCIMGGKRPYHTIIPGFLMKDGKPVGPFGIMGGFMQPQAHLQVMLSYILDGRNPQDCLDKPRWQWTGKKTLEAEPSFDNNILQKLRRMGHDVKITDSFGAFGRGNIIFRNDDGVLCGGTEPRTDGCIAAW